MDSLIRLIIAAPDTGSTSPASKIGVAPKSIPVSLQRFADSEAKAARMSGGASAAPRINEEFSSQGTPIVATLVVTCIYVVTSSAILLAIAQLAPRSQLTLTKPRRNPENSRMPAPALAL